MKRRWIAAALLAALLLSGCGPEAPPVADETRTPVRVPVTEPAATPTVPPTVPPTVAPTVPPTEPTDPKPAYEVLRTFEPAITQESNRLSYDTPKLDLDTNGLGYLGITLTNTSKANGLTVYFTTDEDPNFTIQKSVTVTIDTEQTGSRFYLVDISELYGFTSSLDTIRILSTAVYDGTLTLEKLEIYNAGALIPPFTLSDEVVIATRDEMKASTPSGASLYPDGIMSALYNGDGTYTFISSGPLSGQNTVTSYIGTLDNPVQKFHYEARSVKNAPFGYGLDEFNYVSVGQIYRFQGSECFTMLHLEHHFDSNGGFDENGLRSSENNAGFVASLALGYSPDNGETWYYCGEIATHSCESIHPYYGFGSAAPTWMQYAPRDVGSGPFVIKDGQVYVYMIDYDASYKLSLAVLRADLDDVIAAARGMETGQKTDLFKKYYQGSFSEPAIAGKSTSVIDDECPPNFTTIIYSTYLNKYVMARCSSPAYGTNDGDIVLNISDDLTNFRGNNYYIDTDTTGSQYPTLLAISGEDPVYTAGDTLYLYYISAVRDDRFLWDKADIVRRTITFK